MPASGVPTGHGPEPGTDTCHEKRSRVGRNAVIPRHAHPDAVPSTGASRATTSDSQWHLPRHCAGQPPAAPLHRGPRSSEVPRPARPRRQTPGLAMSRVLLDAEPLPPRLADTQRRSVGGDASNQQLVRPLVQRLPRVRRPPLSGSLSLSRRRKRLASPRAVPLPHAEPGPRTSLQIGRGLAMEQLSSSHGRSPRAGLLGGQRRARVLRERADKGKRGVPSIHPRRRGHVSHVPVPGTATWPF
jgi:hypothetical protein